MLVIIKSNFRRIIKSPVSILIIFCMLLLSYLWIISSEKEKLDRNFTDYDVYNMRNTSYDFQYLEDDADEDPSEIRSSQAFVNTHNALKLAHISGDIQEITRMMSFFNLIYIRKVSDGNILADDFKKDVLPLWENVSNGLDYESLDFSKKGQKSNPYAGSFFLNAKHYDYLYRNEIEPLYKDDVNTVVFLVEYFHNIFPYLIFMGIGLILYNSINREKNIGSLKLILTQSISRKKYYMSKWIAGVSALSFIFIIPPLIISLIVGITNGFSSFIYPIRMYEKTWMTLIPIKIHQYFGGRLLFTLDPFTSQSIELIPFYQYLFAMIFLSLLFIAFMVALTQFVSAVVNNERFSMVVLACVYVVGIGISQLSISKFELNLLPIGFYNISKTIGGNQYVTALGASLILIVSTVLMLGVGLKYFNKKHI